MIEMAKTSHVWRYVACLSCLTFFLFNIYISMVVCSVLLIAIRIRAEIRTNEAKLLLLKLPANTFDQKVNFISEAFEKKVFCIPEIMKAIDMNLHDCQRILEHFEAIRCDDAVHSVIVFSDIDDTIVSTFKDMRFPFNCMYPGSRQFLHCLVSSRGDDSPPWNIAKVNVMFVTARPSLMNCVTRMGLNKFGLGNNLLLQGTSISFCRHRSMLEQKLRQCKQMHRVYPESMFYLVGDNGQADIDLGKELLKNGLVENVFIHDIFRPLSNGEPIIRFDRVSSSVPIGHRFKECIDHGLVMFRSYAGASLSARNLGIFSEQDLIRVVLSSAAEFSNIKFTSESQRMIQRDVLLRDAVRVVEEIEDDNIGIEILRKIHGILDFKEIY